MDRRSCTRPGIRASKAICRFVPPGIEPVPCRQIPAVSKLATFTSPSVKNLSPPLALRDGRTGVADSNFLLPDDSWSTLGKRSVIPVSFHVLSRLGPIHRGQSSASAGWLTLDDRNTSSSLLSKIKIQAPSGKFQGQD